MAQFHFPIRIILVDDHRLIIQAYSALLNDVAHFEVAGSACNGKDVLNLLEDTGADVILLDANMPVMNGYETLKLIRKLHPKLKIIILTMHTEPVFIFNFLLHGANAFLGKNCEQEELIQAIDTVMAEGYYFSSTVSKHVTSNNEDGIRNGFKRLRLTERETDILKLICEDVANEDIAKALNISANTIKFFKKNIYRKTSSNSTIGLIKYAIRHGIFAVG